MPAQIEYRPNDICVLRISGILKRSEFGAEQTELACKIDIGSKPRLLVILENFEGWERGADWNDHYRRRNKHSSCLAPTRSDYLTPLLLVRIAISATPKPSRINNG